MAITDQLILDLSQALAQLDDLERELDGLLQPITIPVEVEAAPALSQLQRDIRAADTDDIDIDVNTADLSDAEREIAELQDELSEAVDDARDFEREIRQAGDEAERTGRRGSTAFGGLRQSLGGLAVAAAGFIGFREVSQFLGESIQAASDLEESTSKAQVVFGSFFDDIQDFANTAPQALGLANSAALEFTGTFGNLFTALGLSQQAAADLAPDIVQLGADLASFNNLEVTDALDKLRAGLVGEAEPLRALGVNLSAAAVEAKALELGLAGSTGEIDDAAKVQARYALILEQTTNAQGDFARTADSIANRQRTLAANFQRVQASIGEALLPAFETLLDAAEDLVPVLEDAAPALGELAESAISLVGPVLELVGPVGALVGLFGDLKANNDALVQSGNPFDQLVGGVTDLATSGVFENFNNLFDEIRFQVETGFRSNTIAQAVAEINEEVERGRGPVAALVDAYESLAGEGLVTAGVLEDLVAAADLGGTELIQALEELRDLDTISAGELEAIEQLLFAIIAAEAEIPPDPFAGLDEGIAVAQRAARDAPAIVDGFDSLGRSFERLNDIAARGLDDQVFRDLENIPSVVDNVSDALQGDDGLVTVFSDFFDNLEDELAREIEFDALLDQLSELGFEKLEEGFREAGVGSLDALRDGFTDPAELAEAEQALDRAGRQLARAEAIAFGEEAAQFVATFDPIEIPGELEFNEQTAQDQLNGVTGLTVGLDGIVTNVTVPDLPSGVVSVPGGFGDAGGQVVVNQTFDNTPGPTTETTRAAQSARSIVNQVS